MGGLDIGRVAEIIVTTAAGKGLRGSGYLVAAGRVLTAAHVLTDAVAVRVRFDADRPGERVLDAEVVFTNVAIDVAVLSVAAVAGGPARFGRVGERDAVLRCSAVGFPAFKLREDEDGSRYRDSEHVQGTCPVLSNRREGTLDLHVPAPRGDWDGMSGAVAFSDGRIVGIVVIHHPADGPGRLAVSRADRWAERLSADERKTLEKLLGTELLPDRLPDVLVSTGSGRTRTGFEELLRDIAPPELLGREAELKDLVTFCAGREPYRWLRGGPWVGKTALVSWFALHPPRGVIPVWFFITSRLAGQADVAAYTEALVHQLAWLAGREPSSHTSPIARDVERRQLLREAAEHVAEDGGTLLLIVDGLDEDQSARLGSGVSIASLLPEHPPDNVRVLVTSRPNPALPLSVKPTHPLRRCMVRWLDSTHVARNLEDQARFELNQAFAGDAVEKDIVGLLAAARGGLRPEDLRELSGQALYAVRHRVDSVFGRILRSRSTVAGEPAERRYLFAHETLYEAAVHTLGPDIHPYRERIEEWAESYRRRSWPEDTPPYLLESYVPMLAENGDTARAMALATDAARHHRMRAITGSDAAAFAEIDAVRRELRRKNPGDVGDLAVLTATEDTLSRRNALMPANIPAIVARLGQLRRAEGLARTVVPPSYRPMAKARALAAVARVMAERGEPRAVGLALESERLARGIMEDGRPLPAYDVYAVFRDAATALAGAGLGERARGMVGSLRTVLLYGEFDGDVEYGPSPPFPRFSHERRLASREAAMALVDVSAALRGRDALLAADILDEAEQGAEEEAHASGRVQVLAKVLRACSGSDRERHCRVLGRIERTVTDPAADALQAADTLSAAAVALHDVLPERAAHWAQELSRRFTSGSSTEREWTRTNTGQIAYARTIQTLTALHMIHHAQTLIDAYVGGEELNHRFRRRWEDPTSSEDPMSWAVLRNDSLAAIACAWARAGHADKAREALQQRRRPGLFGEVGTETRKAVACALAASGLVAEAEKWANSMPGTLAAMAERLCERDRDQAERLVESAMNRYSPIIGYADTAFFEALAGALAACGDQVHAERLARRAVGRTARALAAVAPAVGGGRAARLTADAREFADRPYMDSNDGRDKGLAAVADALARTRQQDAALSLLAKFVQDMESMDQWGRLISDDPGRRLNTIRIPLVSSLWEWAPTAAASLADDVERDWDDKTGPVSHILFHTSHQREYSVDLMARLIAAVGDRDMPRSRRLVGKLKSLSLPDDERIRSETWVLAAMAVATTEPDHAEALLLRADARLREYTPDEPLTPRSLNVRAVSHAAAGDYETAEELAERIPAGRERATCLASVAALLVGLPDDATLVHLDVLSGSRPHLLRLGADLLGPPTAADIEDRLRRARRLVAKAMASEEWYHALPVLAQLDRDAVRSVGAVVFSHLDL